jgi:DNA-binding FrmR family transcriptional regulator
VALCCNQFQDDQHDSQGAPPDGKEGQVMATKKISHVLSDEEQLLAIAKRVKRAHGQLGAVARMLEEGRNCEEIVTQMSAVAKAVNTAAFTLISASLKECLIEGKNNQEEVTAQLQKLFLSLA